MKSGEEEGEREKETKGRIEEAMATTIHEIGKDARRTYKGIGLDVDARVADEEGPEFEGVKNRSVPAAVI